MKKMFLVTVAALTVLGQAQLAQAAGVGGRPVARTMKATEVRRETDKDNKDKKDKDGKPVPGEVKVSQEAAKAIRQVDELSLANRLSAEQSRKLKDVLASNEAALKAFNEIIALSKDAKLNDLLSARLEGLSNLGKIKKSDSAVAALDAKRVLNEEGYTALVLDAGSLAVDWSPATRTSMTKFLTEVNDLIAQGRSVSEAIEKTAEKFLKESKNGVDPEAKDVEAFIKKIKEFCKK